jgi:haloalkane dehalogenase
MQFVASISLDPAHRSDKPADRADYTYQRHVDWMHAFVRALDLQQVTLVGQDWGGFIGLRVAAEAEERFARIMVANTFLPTGDHSPGEGFSGGGASARRCQCSTRGRSPR